AGAWAAGPAPRDAPLSVPPATSTAGLGPNGGGQTSQLTPISAFVRPRQGRSTLHGADLTRRRPEEAPRAGLAHVPEGQGVITELTVEENLRLGALWRHGHTGRAEALADAYRRFPLVATARGRSAGTLSGGERQILVIAR